MRDPRATAAELGDFTATWRLVPISAIALGIGLLAAVVALALLRLIGLVTNLAFFQRWDVVLVSPAGHRLGALVVGVPILGAHVVRLASTNRLPTIAGLGLFVESGAVLSYGPSLFDLYRRAAVYVDRSNAKIRARTAVRRRLLKT